MDTREHNAAILSELSPRPVWEAFEQLLLIPRQSGNESAVRRHCAAVAAYTGCAHKIDATGNLLISVPASAPEFAAAPTAVLQAHLDMVCVKRPDLAFDFSRDPIRVVRELNWLKADGTTLGADNGIGVAAALAVVLSDKLDHGPLEILLTVDEEVGMGGARGVKPGWFGGKLLLNLDSEDFRTVYIGCAGGSDMDILMPASWEPVPEGHLGAVLAVRGLFGGHSGEDINKNRGNAVKLLARALAAMPEEATIADFNAGDVRNAIPRFGEVRLTMPMGSWPAALAAVNRVRREAEREFPEESRLRLAFSQAATPPRALPRDLTVRLAGLLRDIPSGVIAMSADLPGFVETSNNLAIVRTHDDRIGIRCMARSSDGDALHGVLEEIRRLAAAAGAASQAGNEYPGWQPKKGSPLVRLVKDVHERHLGTVPRLRAIHAGLECGLLAEKSAGLDMCSFGPVIASPHSPDERVDIPSVAEFWMLLRHVLAAIARGELDAD